ncbi:MAG: hypothetical protein WD096_02595 [Actinomycetota bacterium]
MSDLLDEDVELRGSLAALGDGALGELRALLTGPQEGRDRLLVSLVARPQLKDLATLISMADTDPVVRLRLLRAIRDLSV